MQEKAQKPARARGTLILFYWLGIMAVALLLVTATYTWFSLSRTPRVSDLGLYVVTPTGLEIALKADAPDEDWGQALDYEDLVPESAPLKPCTWSEANGRFVAMTYGLDGRMSGAWKMLSDARNANNDSSEGYYTLGTFYARSATPCSVSLSEAILLEDGTKSAGTFLIGQPLWNAKALKHEDGGAGAQYAVRIGLRLTPVDLEGEPLGESRFIIYEPNADTHVSGEGGYIRTASIDGTEDLVPTERLITQNATLWTENDPVQRGVTQREMGAFTAKTELFSLKKNDVMRIDLYVWLEGQDVDCTNQIGTQGQLFASLQFGADYTGQSGMEEIP